MSGIIRNFQYGDHEVTLEAGIMAKLATASVVVRMAGTCVLVAVVGKKENNAEPRGFFPLTVNYQEKSYASGKFPGGYFKREGRPSERETLISRLMDRPIRPLFPEGFEAEVNITATVLSINPEVNPDIPAMIGASCALAISGMPFNGPIGAARVGMFDGEYKLNPSHLTMSNSELDLVVAGTEKAVLMVESEANCLTEEQMLGAVAFGHKEMQIVIKAIKVFSSEVNKANWEWSSPTINEQLFLEIKENFESSVAEAYKIQDKTTRQNTIGELKIKLAEKYGTAEASILSEAKNLLSKLEKDIVRNRVLAGDIRIDGRDHKTVRPINIDVGIFPRVHGSALFTRGETQALVMATLGTDKDAQIVEDIAGEVKEHFILHYNFPPYCVGEVGMMSGPKRRDIGHGRLAKRALSPVMPDAKDFPYSVRVVSEIMESNGSSSMASVCGGTLAMMDAGIPIKAPVAGIAMGLVKDGDAYAILTDILGDEDHLGDMDFKVAGTKDGITALQMDIKIDGITHQIMEEALAQAKEARMHILRVMDNTISSPRSEVSEYAPRIVTMTVHPDKIRDIIGKGGVTIRAITEETGVSIDISDEGVVKIAAVDERAAELAREKIKLITTDAEVGVIYNGKVTKIVDFGAFVNFLPGKEGLVHISQISHERIENVNDVLSEGQEIVVKVIEIDRSGKVRLSMKDIQQTKQSLPVEQQS